MVQFERTVNQKKKFCSLRKKQTSPRLRGIERLLLRITKTVTSDYSRGRVYHIDSMLNFLLKAIPFILVISSEGFKQKQLICNSFVTNLSNIHNFEGVRF